ncbi:hypothetical protein, partial [Bacillus thuringiensis]|uniref:hypothetical protein n=1 Tax=Bacillus thuringiensis TaxID=1428 RepID=UPI0035DD9977
LYGLQANKEIIINRIENDIKPQNSYQRKQWLHVNDEILEIKGLKTIDTSTLTIDEVVNTIRELEEL